MGLKAGYHVPHEGAAKFNPSAYYAQQPMYKMSTGDIRKAIDIPANVTFHRTEYDAASLPSVSFFWDETGRRAVLRGLAKAAAGKFPSCQNAIFLYRVWGALAAGMNDKYSGL